MLWAGAFDRKIEEGANVCQYPPRANSSDGNRLQLCMEMSMLTVIIAILYVIFDSLNKIKKVFRLNATCTVVSRQIENIIEKFYKWT